MREDGFRGVFVPWVVVGMGTGRGGVFVLVAFPRRPVLLTYHRPLYEPSNGSTRRPQM